MIFPLIEAKAPIYGYHSPEYIKDIGTPERLLEAEQSETGIVKKKNLKLSRNVYLWIEMEH